MKLLRKIAAIMLSIMMVLGMASVVSAEGTGTTTSGTSATTKGKITIDNAKSGQTYKIYQILELESFSDKSSTGTNTGNYAYKVVTEWNEFITTGEGKAYLEIKDGYVKWKGATDDASVAEFAKEALAYATNKKLTATRTADKVTSTTVEFTDLALGYYLVDSSAGALCSLNTTDTDVTIQEKNGVPSVEKKVQEDSKVNTKDEWGKSNTADIGQIVNFQTTITAQPGAQNYVLHDKMDAGLTFDANSVQVNLKKKGETTENVVVASNYEVKTSGLENPNPCTFHVVFTPEFCNTLEDGDQIIVAYSATLDDAVPKTEYNNETWLKYGENNETNHDTTKTKTFELPVFKYTTKDGSKTALAGATFTLSKNNEGTQLISLVKISGENVAEGTYRVAKTGDADTVKKVTTPASGKFTIKGLDADTYYLTETQQPAGYNKLKDPVKVVIKEDGTITVGENTTTTVNEVEVENNTGSILPSTGGSGTTMIYILGAILVLGSSVVLITKKRMR